MYTLEERDEDYKTNKVREDLSVKVTDKQYHDLKLLAYKAGFASAGTLLSSFVGDLTSWHSNGSDERHLADEWYERAFHEWTRYFRYHLFEYNYGLGTISEMLDDADYFDDIYEEYEDAKYGSQDIESKEDCLKLLKEIVKDGKKL